MSTSHIINSVKYIQRRAVEQRAAADAGLEDERRADSYLDWAQKWLKVFHAELERRKGDPLQMTDQRLKPEDVRALTAAVPLHVVVNRAPASPYRRAEVAGEIRRTFEPASLTFAPHDARVEAAAWAGELVGPGPFTRALAELADQVLPPLATPARRGLWRWRR